MIGGALATCSPLIGRRANFSRILVETIKKLQGKVDTVVDTGPAAAAEARGLELGTENPDIPGVSSKVESWIVDMDNADEEDSCTSVSLW